MINKKGINGAQKYQTKTLSNKTYYQENFANFILSLLRFQKFVF